ncbi:FMN-binding protein [Lactococcus chungangensis CAU 28 = DSM 22330]|uniref:FMN-binding protein n=2 Tax=Pseudolactococcus chungangensis CAU 28 = DSM 22330 TaxID=1122154 RepID=A0ABX4I440_9LACT|nr:FMN-binding protein [Lactococcus chungangensis CAU 28 = DSM 22330]
MILMIKKLIRRILLAIVALIAVIDGYLIFFKNSKQPTTASTVNSASSTTNKNDSEGAVGSGSTASSSSTQDTKSASSMADGTYTGASTQTEWGPVQVQITISSGKITNVDVLSYPDTEKKSIQINENALPTYKEEALTAQSSNIDQISGATETYKGFTGSLQDSITQSEAAS